MFLPCCLYGAAVRRPVLCLPPFRSAVFPCRTSRQVLQQVHPHVFVFSSDEAQPEGEHPHVVFCARLVVGALVFRGGALGVPGEGGDGEAEEDVHFYLARVGRAVEGANLDRTHSPYIVEVDRPVAGIVVMGGFRNQAAEPCFVQLVFGGRFFLFQPVDKSPVGAFGVVCEAVRQGSDRLQNQLLLLVPDSREVCDLAGVEIADPDVDVLAGAARCFCSGFPEFPYHRLEGVHVLPPQNRGYHFGARCAVVEASVADGFPVAAVRCDHRPLIVSPAAVPDRSAYHAVDRLGSPFPADVGVLQFRPEGESLRRFHNFVGHVVPPSFGC